MSIHETTDSENPDFDLVGAGWSNRLLDGAGLQANTPLIRLVKLLIILLIAWIPLSLLSLVTGRFSGQKVEVPFSVDIEAHIRFLLVLPLLEFARFVVSSGMAKQARHLSEMGIIHERDMPRLDAARKTTLRIRKSVACELIIILLSFGFSFLFRVVVGMSEGTSSWERDGGRLTAAGWWHTLISLPWLYYFVLRWIFVILCWDWFLFKVSRLPLQLTSTHPDKVGGLGFLGWGIAVFAPVLMSTSLVFSAGVATEIIQHRESLDSLKYHCLIFAIALLVVIYLPLFAFAKQLANCRFAGLLEFGELVWKHDRQFEEKWMAKDGETPDEPLLGNADVQSMADIATCYGHINEMWLIPFDMKAFAVLVVSIALPLAPLLATTVELREMVMKIGELLM